MRCNKGHLKLIRICIYHNTASCCQKPPLFFYFAFLIKNFLIGFGTFFLQLDKEPKKPLKTGEAWHLLAALLAVSIIWWMQILHSQGSFTIVPTLFVVTTIGLFAHDLTQKLSAYSIGLQTTFKAWGSEILFSWLIVLFGGFFQHTAQPM